MQKTITYVVKFEVQKQLSEKGLGQLAREFQETLGKLGVSKVTVEEERIFSFDEIFKGPVSEAP